MPAPETGTPTLTSRIAAVTVYRNWAQIERLADLPAGAPGHVRIAGLPLALDDASVAVEVEAEKGTAAPVATDLRIALEVPPFQVQVAPDLEKKLRDAQRVEVALDADLSRIAEAIQSIEGLDLPDRPEGHKGGAPPASPLTARTTLLEFQATEVDRLVAEREALEEKKRAATTERERLEALISVAAHEAQIRPHELRKSVIVRLHVEGAGAPARLRLRYLIPGVVWAPSYRVQFDGAMSKARLTVRAMVAQGTGEDWENVRLTLATAHAQRWTELPELKAIRIGRRQPAKPVVGWRPPPEGAEALFADFDAAFGGPSGAPDNAFADGMDVSIAEPSPADDVGAELDESASEVEDRRPAKDAKMKREMSRSARRDEPKGGASASMAGPPMPPASAPPPPPSPMRAPAPSTLAKPRPAAQKEMAKSSVEEREGEPAEYPSGRGRSADFGAAGGSLSGLAPEEAPMEPASGLAPGDDLLDFPRLRLAAPNSVERGKLRAVGVGFFYLEGVAETERARAQSALGYVRQASAYARRVSYLDPPPGCAVPEPAGDFDHAYPADGPVSIPSDGQFHAIPLATRDAAADQRYVIVPRESTDAFRFVEVANPLDAPLLAGPADIHVGEDYLLTAPLHQVPARGQIRLGLGVEQGIKVARNTRFEEQTGGMLGGTLNLLHEIRIEVKNTLARPARCEVRERTPVVVPTEQHVKVVDGEVVPPWEKYDPDEYALSGGHRWTTTVPPGETAKLSARYTVQISSKDEVAGGNRREG